MTFDRMDGGNGSRATGRMLGGNILGEILKLDEQSVTVKVANSGTRLVFLSEKTQVTKTEPAGVADLAAGVSVRIMGSSNQDGSVSAQSIQILPAGFGQASQPPAAAPLVQPVE